MDAVFSVPWLYSELANATAASGEGTQTSGPSNEAQIIFDAITSNSKPVCTKKVQIIYLKNISDIVHNIFLGGEFPSRSG